VVCWQLRLSRANIVFHSCRDKENETPDLEEFGYSKTHTTPTCSDAQQQSPSKESPSRRVKLMGSLKRIGSFRNIRSSPLKERGTEPAEYPEGGRVSARTCCVDTPLSHPLRVLVHQAVVSSHRSHSTSRSHRRISQSSKSSVAAALPRPVWTFSIRLQYLFLLQLGRKTRRLVRLANAFASLQVRFRALLLHSARLWRRSPRHSNRRQTAALHADSFSRT
jgi:hypothetical protein